MSQQDKQDAAEKAARAMRQARHSVNNAGEAAESAAEFAKDEVVDAASAVKDGAQAIAKKAVYTEVGRSVVFFGLGIATVALGFKKLGEARALMEAAKANPGLMSDGV
jgi:hypothetical protein